MSRGKAERPISYTITPSAGRWHGFAQVGIDAGGQAMRAHRTVTFCPDCKINPAQDCAARCYKRCVDKIRAVEDAVTAGKPVERQTGNPGAVQVITDYLTLCQERVDASTMAYHTLRSYRLQLGRVTPQVHTLRIRQLDRDGIRTVLREVQRTVSTDAARKVLTVLRIMLGWAMRQGYVDRNEAELVEMPTLGQAEAKIEPLSEDEFASVIPVIWSRPQRRGRWLFGLIHGQRQSECLGLDLFRPDQPRLGSDVNLKKGIVTIREKVERRDWEHGCTDPQACAATRPDPRQPGRYLPNLHRTSSCPPRWQHGCGMPPSECTGNRTDRCPRRQPLVGCRDHRNNCPPPCPPRCTQHASSCPQRRGGGIVKARTKNRGAEHTIVLDPLVVAAFELDLVDRREWEARAGSKWVDSGAVVVNEFGARVDPRRDWDDWQSILAEAGLPPTRVHDLRHTAATNMLAAGLDKRTVQKLIGWSQDMSHVYVHVVEAVQRSATTQLSAWLRNTGALADPPPPAAPEPPLAAVEPDSATAVLPDDLGNVIPFRRKAG